MSAVLRRVVLQGLAGTLMALSVVVFAPGMAQAAIGGYGTIGFPESVTVGQTAVGGEIAIVNDNSGDEVNVTNTVCTADGSPQCGSQGLVIVPGCHKVDGGAWCAAGAAELGLFRVAPTAVGKLGSACAGMQFAASLIDTTMGTLLFTPQPAGTKLYLSGSGARCAIAFTFDVLKMPEVDWSATAAGAQTVEMGRTYQWASGGSGGGTSTSGTTVSRARPTITTTPSGSDAPGGQLVDSVTIGARAYPQPGATIEFKLYAPDEATCSGPPVFRSAMDYPVSTGVPVSSAPHTPTKPGIYHWVVSYSGDANNSPVTSGCKAANTLASAAPGAAQGSAGAPGTAKTIGSRAARRITARFASGNPRTGRLGFASTPVIHGVLKDDLMRGVGDARISVLTRLGQAGAQPRRTGSVTTREDGSFTYRLPSGPSRTVTFTYAGGEDEGPPTASTSVRTVVRASLTARITPRSPRAGRPIRLAGRLRHLPRAGVQVLVEARDGRVWRPIGTAKTKAGGRFAWSYRFKATAANRRFALRARVDSPIYPFAAGNSAPVIVHVRA
ncbi:MAG: hypothetical protein QOC64_2611 [Solirubrobacteraceae bacterium]|jgi:hypothetical protein|nr:hypothetical protein [Solirubrobacteraceae bacterium]